MTLRRTGERKKGIIIKLVEEVSNKLSGFRYRKLMSGSGLVWSGQYKWHRRKTNETSYCLLYGSLAYAQSKLNLCISLLTLILVYMLLYLPLAASFIFMWRTDMHDYNWLASLYFIFNLFFLVVAIV